MTIADRTIRETRPEYREAVRRALEATGAYLDALAAKVGPMVAAIRAEMAGWQAQKSAARP